MNCQQICKISLKKTTKVKILQKVLGGATYFETPGKAGKYHASSDEVVTVRSE